MKTLLIIACAWFTVPAAEAQKRIPVHLYSLSGLDPATLDRAAREAFRIFAQVDVVIDWQRGSPEADEARTTDQSGPAAFRDSHIRPYLVVRIGRGLAFRVPSGALGISLPHAQFGVSATIFQERVESYVPKRRARPCRDAGPRHCTRNRTRDARLGWARAQRNHAGTLGESRPRPGCYRAAGIHRATGGGDTRLRFAGGLGVRLTR